MALHCTSQGQLGLALRPTRMTNDSVHGWPTLPPLVEEVRLYYLELYKRMGSCTSTATVILTNKEN
jgi:hypothetical protein